MYGTTQSAWYNPHYLIMEKLSLAEGYTSIPEIKTLSASCYELTSTTSKAIGSTLFGGYVTDLIGYYNTCLIYACLLVFTATWKIVFLKSQGLLKSRVYYVSKNVVDNGDMFAMEGTAENGRSLCSNNENEKSIKSQLLQSISRSYDIKNL